MTKQEFSDKLRTGLKGLPKEDIEERITFYSEMIDDRIEEGLSEAEAISDIGTIDELVAQCKADIPLTKIVKEKIKSKKKLNALEIVLLVLGSPLWLSILVAVFAVVISLCIAVLSVIIVLWAVFLSFALCGFAGVITGIFFAVSSSFLTGTAVTGAGLLLLGLSVFLFFGCKAATKSIVMIKWRKRNA